MSIGYNEFRLAIDWLCSPLDGWATLRWVVPWLEHVRVRLGSEEAFAKMQLVYGSSSLFEVKCLCTCVRCEPICCWLCQAFKWTLLMKNTRPFAYLLQRTISLRGAARQAVGWLSHLLQASSNAMDVWRFTYSVCMWWMIYVSKWSLDQQAE
jgi:hypothetical protein